MTRVSFCGVFTVFIAAHTDIVEQLNSSPRRADEAPPPPPHIVVRETSLRFREKLQSPRQRRVNPRPVPPSASKVVRRSLLCRGAFHTADPERPTAKGARTEIAKRRRACGPCIRNSHLQTPHRKLYKLSYARKQGGLHPGTARVPASTMLSLWMHFLPRSYQLQQR